jgi:hypothetical protein
MSDSQLEVADRALLARAAREPLPVPDELRRRLQAELEARLLGRARPGGRLALALAGVLLAGSALAYGLAGPPAPSPPAPMEKKIVPPPERPVRRKVARARAVVEPTVVAPAVEPLPPPPVTAAPSEPEEPAPAPPRLVIAREGRPDVTLALAGDRVVGKVGESPVALAIGGGQILGKLGEHNVWLWLRGHEAGGDIGGVPVKLQLVETDAGYQLREGFSVRTTLPYAATRVEATSRALSWAGCDAPFSEVAPGVYEGRCASGARARVSLSPSWRELPVLERLILLSFFLTERDPAFGKLFPR